MKPFRDVLLQQREQEAATFATNRGPIRFGPHKDSQKGHKTLLWRLVVRVLYCFVLYCFVHVTQLPVAQEPSRFRRLPSHCAGLAGRERVWRAWRGALPRHGLAGPSPCHAHPMSTRWNGQRDSSPLAAISAWRLRASTERLSRAKSTICEAAWRCWEMTRSERSPSSARRCAFSRRTPTRTLSSAMRSMASTICQLLSGPFKLRSVPSHIGRCATSTLATCTWSSGSRSVRSATTGLRSLSRRLRAGTRAPPPMGSPTYSSKKARGSTRLGTWRPRRYAARRAATTRRTTSGGSSGGLAARRTR